MLAVEIIHIPVVIIIPLTFLNKKKHRQKRCSA